MSRLINALDSSSPKMGKSSITYCFFKSSSLLVFHCITANNAIFPAGFESVCNHQLPIFDHMNKQPVFILSGEQGEGKTTKLENLFELLVALKISVKGFTAPGKWDNNTRSCFYIKDLLGGKLSLLCQNQPSSDFIKIGRFYFDPETIMLGENIILNAGSNDLIVIDEIGLFETKGYVWGPILHKLIERNTNPLVVVVRSKFINQVLSHFSISNYHIFDLKTDVNTMAEEISNFLLK